MAFDSLSDTPTANPLSADAVAATAREAAQVLVSDLDRAEQCTDCWQNESLAQLLVNHALSECLDRLAATGCWGEANRLPSSVFWKTAGPRLEAGTLQQRARTKPLGYAGDHMILARMWEQSCCDDPLGRLLDRYFLALAAPQAVRARLEHVAGTLASRRLDHSGPGYRVVSVGSGPGIDIQTALAALPEEKRAGVGVTLLDLDPEALEHASRRIVPLIPQTALVCRRENLYRLASNRRLGKELAGTDLVICTGFFDYLRDEVATEMLRFFWDSLAPGGEMLVGNFAPHNPTRAYMEWIGNWYLTYRSADEFGALGIAAGIPGNRLAIQCDRTGTDLFLVAERI